MKGAIVMLAALVAVGAASCAKKSVGIVGKEISYNGGGVQMKGYLAYDGDITGKRPGVLVVHEWWGLNDYARKRARMLAGLGYVALAVDMYGNGETATHPNDAGKFAGEVMQHMDTAKARFVAAEDVLKQQELCDSTRVAAIGYCFGGGIVMRMALLGFPLAGVASFHGDLPTDMNIPSGQATPRMLVCNGADDPFNPPAKVEAFKKSMQSGGVDVTFTCAIRASPSLWSVPSTRA